MEMNLYKWLVVILVGVTVGILLTHYLAAEYEPDTSTFAQWVDQYGLQIEGKSENSVQYVGYKKSTLYDDFDNIQLTFKAIDKKLERSHDQSTNKKKAQDWDALFCTEQLYDIADNYDGESNKFLGQVRVIISGVVLTTEGQQGINALCRKSE